MNETKVMKTLHDIRRRHFEEIKNLTGDEKLKRLHEEAKELVKLIEDNRRKKLELNNR